MGVRLEWPVRLGIAAVVTFAIAGLVVVAGGTPSPIDSASRELAHRWTFLEPTGAWVSEWSLKIAQPIILACLVVLLVRREWIPPVAMLLVFAVGDLAVTGFKEAFHRPRPEEAILQSFAFPSAHATGAAHQWGILLLLAVPLVMRQSAPRWWLVLLWVGIAGVTSLARVAEGEHWLTDVVAGFAVGAFLAAVSAWASLRAWGAARRSHIRGKDQDLQADAAEQGVPADAPQLRERARG